MNQNARALAQFMSELSEQAYSASWMQHLEFALWHAVVSGPFQYGRLAINEGHIDRLRALRDKCEGWIYFDDQSGESWVALEEWQDMYSRNIDLVRLT